MTNRIDRQDIADVAARIGVEPAALAAVLAVECRWPRRRGFDTKGRVRILWERHKCWKYATKAERAKLPREICNPKRGGYPKGRNATERNGKNWARLHRARKVMGDRAYLCASWGLPQIMGFNHEAAGYAHVTDMVADFARGERQQLEALARFIMHSKTLRNALRRRHWGRFAKSYNGQAYKENKYDTELRDAYARLSRRKWPPARTAAPPKAAPPPSGPSPRPAPPPPRQDAPVTSRPARRQRGGFFIVTALAGAVAAIAGALAAAWDWLTHLF